MTKPRLILVTAALAALGIGLADERVRKWVGAGLELGLSSASAQEVPDEDDDTEEVDDAGGDGVGQDDLGNDGAADDLDAAGDGADAEAGAGDDAGGDDAAGDDGAGEVGGAGGDDGPGDDDGATGGGGDDDGPGGDDAPGGADDDGPVGDDGPVDDDNVGDAGNADDRRGVRRSGGDDAPGGAGVRGADADGGVRIRDGDRDVAGLAALPDGVDVDNEGRWVRAGEILALEADPTSLELARGLGFQIVERYRLTTLGLSIVELRVPRGQQTRAALEAVRRADPDTAYDFNHVYLPVRGVSFAPAVAAAGPAGAAPTLRSASIGIVDTGVDVTHPALARASIVQSDFVARGTRPAVGAGNSHGTAVASILVGSDPAAARPRQQGRLFAANVVGRAAQGADLASADAMVRALDWLARNQTPVANISLAGPPNSLVEDAVRRAQARGMIIVAAVGNDGPAAPPLYPAAYDGVIGVTAVDANGEVYRRAGRGPHVDVAARGVGVQVAAPGGRMTQASGTSFAAPLVAAALATRHDRPDAASARAAVAQVLASTADAGDRGRDPIYGTGVLKAGENVQ